jgi:hypothetical protein
VDRTSEQAASRPGQHYTYGEAISDSRVSATQHAAIAGRDTEAVGEAEIGADSEALVVLLDA